MNNKKIQAQMQIDVSFIGDSTKLLKALESSFSKLNLTSSLTKGLETDLTKSFKNTYANLEKMSSGLSKKGLSTKQYNAFFTELNDKIRQSSLNIDTLKTRLTDIFKGESNKRAIKDLENYKKQLVEINEILTKQRASTTRANTSKTKLMDEFGLDTDNKYVKNALSNLLARRQSGNLSLTPTQKNILGKASDDEGKIKRIIQLYQQWEGHIQKINDANKQIQQISGSTGSGANIAANIEKEIAALNTVIISEETYKNNLSILSQIQKEFNGNLDISNNLLLGYNTELPRATAEAEKLAKAESTIREILGQFGIVFSAATVVRGFQDLTRSAFDFYKSLDSALNEIYVVSNLTSTAVDGLKANFIAMAKETGMALDDITRSATLFYQQGLSTEEVLEMTEVTSEFAKVAGIDATDAADKLTAAVNGYCLAAGDAIDVADKFNKVAAASAADINELSTAFSKAAAQANQAGVSMDNYLAYIATMVEATREAPENIGTSLKTIFSRMQQVKEGGTSEDGETDVNQVETALKSVGIQLRDTKNELRDLEDVFDELGPKWNTLDRNTQAYLGTIIAGTRQQSRFITLMQNWDRVLDLADQSANSAGMQALMHEKAMDSISSKAEQLSVAWQEFISNLTDSSLIKGMITTMTKLLNLFNSGSKPITIMATAVGLLASKLKNLQDPIKNKIGNIAKIFSDFGKDSIDAKEKSEQLKVNKEAQNNQANIVKQKQQVLEKLIIERNSLLTKREVTKEEQKQIDQYNTQIQQGESELTTEQNKLNILKEQGVYIKEQQTKWEVRGKAISGIGTALSTAGLLASQLDDNLGGAVSTAGSLVQTIGQFAMGNWIGGIASAAMTLYQAYNVWSNWDDNIAAKMTNAIESVNKEMQELNNISTKTKTINNMLSRYDSLSRKIYRTSQEQEELNNVIQEMSDTLGVDAISDSYGNLSINIELVKEKYQELKAEQKQVLEDMVKIEQQAMKDATSGLGNKNTKEQFYQKLLTEEEKGYKDLLLGIQDGVIDANRIIEDSLFQTFNSSFKNSIIGLAKDMTGLYSSTGLADNIVELETGINDALMSTDGWDYIYSEIQQFQGEIDSLSWEDFSNKFDIAFQSWREEIGLTTEQWMILKDAIQTTIYDGNKEYVDFMNKYDPIRGDLTEAKKLKEETEKELSDFVDGASLYRTYEGIMIHDSSEEKAKGWNEIYEYWKKQNKAIDILDHWTENAGQINQIDKILKFDEDGSLIKELSGEDLQTYLERYDTAISKIEELENQMGDGVQKMYNSLSKLSGQTANEVMSIGSMFDLSNLDEDTELENQYANIMSKAIDSAKDYVNKSDIGLTLINSINEQIANGDIDSSVRELLSKVKDEIESEMPRTGTYTWSGILDSLDSYSENLQTANRAMKELSDDGAVTNDTFRDLASTLDKLNFEDIFEYFTDAEDGINYINGLCDALENLDVAYDVNNGYVMMNADSLEYLQDAQEKAAKGKIKAMINDLAASRASAESQVAYIDAQISATEAMINYIQGLGEATVDIDEMKALADKQYDDSFATNMQNVSNNYASITGDSQKWAEATIYDIAAVTDAWSKYWQAVREGSVNAQELLNSAISTSMKGTFSQNQFTTSGIDLDNYKNIKGNSQQADELLGKLNKYKQGLEEAKSKYSASVAKYTAQIGYLQTLYDSDLSNWGASDKNGSKNKIQQYIGQLEKIYNILNRISTLKGQLEMYDTYSDIADDAKYGELLQTRLNYNQELLNQYAFLVDEQTKNVNGYKDFINSVSGLEGVFSFDDFGQIIINWEKYNQLQDKSIDGEVTLKQKADDVYNTYTEMYESKIDYANEYLTTLKQVISLEQEMIDSYIDMQDKAANAIKEIYKKILDTRLEAIEDEKEAIEDLRKAREQARQDAENAETISDLQTNLQRAMMDTSGASDVAFLQAQKDIDDKLSDIAEDKYSRMLDDIINSLDDEKEQLQNNFDQMFENTEWLFEWLDEEIMRDEERLTELLTQTEEWNTSSNLQRAELMREWDKSYASYMNGLTGGKSIYDLYNELQDNKTKIDNLNTSITNKLGQESINIRQTILSWQKDVSNAISSAVSAAAAGGGSITSGGGGINANSFTGAKDNGEPTSSGGTKFTEDKSYQKWIGKTVEIKGSGNIQVLSPDGSSKQWESSPWGYNPNVIVQSVKKVGSDYYLKTNWKNGVWIKSTDLQTTDFFGKKLTAFRRGGFANYTGPAWLDGTPQHPEAVLDALQTEHFIKFTNALDKLTSGTYNNASNSSISVGNISFNVESMSSPEDGEKAFNMFVDKFKEIGNRTGIKVDTFKNTL